MPPRDSLGHTLRVIRFLEKSPEDVSALLEGESTEVIEAMPRVIASAKIIARLIQETLRAPHKTRFQQAMVIFLILVKAKTLLGIIEENSILYQKLLSSYQS